MPTRNVNLTDEQDSYVDGLIRSGRYQNASEALRDAVRALRQRISEDELKLELLRGQVKAGTDAIARGDFVEVDPDELPAALDRFADGARR